MNGRFAPEAVIPTDRSLSERPQKASSRQCSARRSKCYCAGFTPALRLTVRNVRASGTITMAIRPSTTNTSI
jgi:hypothetical protein